MVVVVLAAFLAVVASLAIEALQLTDEERDDVENELLHLIPERENAGYTHAANPHLDQHDHARYVAALDREIRRHQELLR